MTTEQPYFEVRLTLEQINAVIKSVGITLDKAATKLLRLPPTGRLADETKAEFSALSEGLDLLRDVQHDALVGAL
jgi:hypothetical protein